MSDKKIWDSKTLNSWVYIAIMVGNDIAVHGHIQPVTMGICGLILIGKNYAQGNIDKERLKIID